MADLVLRSSKGSPLTADEVDDNFSALSVEAGLKLDEADFTAANILTKLKTVDGSGSGLDADFLDSQTPTSEADPSTIVSRDTSGNFAAVEITANSFVGDLTGDVDGNATSATIAAACTGNAATVTNGVYTNGTYSDPTWLTISKSKVGLGNVTNESKATMFTNPTFTGTASASTPSAGTNTTQLATTAFVTGAIATAIPAGVILMWSGSVASIPTGWLLCNGLNSTPDLRNTFIVGAASGAGSSYPVGSTGGSADAVVVSHSHTASSTVSDPGHIHSFSALQAIGGYTSDGQAPDERASTTTRNTASSTTGVTVATTITSTGSSATNANLPPYYALCYIMKS